MNKKTRNSLIAVIAVVVLALAIWLIAGGGKQAETPAATETPVATVAPAEETEAPAEEAKDAAEDVKAAAEEKTEEAAATADEATEEVKAAADEVKNAVEEKAEDVKEAAEEKTEEVAAAADEAVEEVKTAVEEKAEDVKEAVEEKAEDVKAAAEEKTEEVAAAADEAAEEVKAAADEVKTAVEEKAEDVKEAAEEKAEDVKEAAEDVKAAAEEKTEEAAAAAEEVVEEVKAAAEGAEEGAEEETVAAIAAAETAETVEEPASAEEAVPVPEMPKAFTVNGKATLNAQNISALASMLLQGDENRLAQLNSLIDFANEFSFKLAVDGSEAEGVVSAKGEDLASARAFVKDNAATVITDVIPSYAFTLTEKDLAELVPALEVDPQKLMEAIMVPLQKIGTSVKFGESEQVEETFFDATFTAKLPVDMTTKEVALLGLNGLKEILDNEEVTSVINQLKARGMNISLDSLDQAIASVQNAKDEDLPAIDAALYTNEQNDMIFRAILTREDQEVMYMTDGVVAGEGVAEIRIPDQVNVIAKVGAKGLTETIKANGMEVTLTVVPEQRETGAAAVATVTLNGLEMVKAEIEMIPEAKLTGSLTAEGRTEITLSDVKGNSKEAGQAIMNDIAANYKPVLKEKTEKIAPDMLSLLAKIKSLVKQQAPAALQQVPVPVAQ